MAKFALVMNDTLNDYFNSLNSAQKEAVSCTQGPCLIIAGAGSGKTRVLTCRIAHILQSCDCRPGEILALTFTKKAAGEMKSRIAQLVGESKARWIYMGTFHSVFIRFLRDYSQQLGYPAQFTIYDKTDSLSIIRQCIKELQLDDKAYKPSYISSRISLAKNNLFTVSGYRASIELQEEDKAAKRPRTADIYELYQRKCKASGAMDFDDILLNMNILLRDFPDALEDIRSRFKYILVDEYQDTNLSQYRILGKLAAVHRNICVVGDDSQSIYGFRGARIENILRFRKDYPDSQEFKLEQNYRSTRTIVGAANSLIEHNERRLKKECFSKADAGEKIDLIRAFTETEEAFMVASSIIDRIYTAKASYDSFAVLYRTNAQSRSLEEALRKKNIPYRIYGSHSFYERAEIKDMLAYFKLTVNTKDSESFSRIVNSPPRGIGATSLDRLAQCATAEGCSLFEAALLPSDKLYAFELKDASIRKLREFALMISSFSEKAPFADCYSLAVEIGNLSGYLSNLQADTSNEGIARFENVEELFGSIKGYSEEEGEMRRILAEDDGATGETPAVTLSDYLENIMLLSEAEKDDEQDPDKGNSNKVTLMTVHASKGLEFPFVYITGMEENLFPSEEKNGSLDKIEEERRLFYVAITRAQKAVTLSYARNRRKWGSEESNRPSRFLREIDRQYLSSSVESDTDSAVHFPKDNFSGNYSTRSRSSFSPEPKPRFSVPLQERRENFTPSPISSLAVGQRVEHDRFGYGTILSMEGMDANKKAVVRFDSGGEKTLLLKFAKLRIL